MLQVRDLIRPGLVEATFEVDDGECVAVMGPSGSGKSLLLRAIADLDPNQGSVRANGLERDSVPAPRWRRTVVYVPAEPGWWAETVGENFPVRDGVEPMLRGLQLSESCLEQPVQRLSTGERQRAALARALLLSPPVLLLDEPTSALDEDNTRVVEDTLRDRMAHGMSLVLATHNREQAARLAARILRVDAGRLSPQPRSRNTAGQEPAR